MRILMVLSLPPVKDGIADHNKSLLASLLKIPSADEVFFLSSLDTSPVLPEDIPKEKLISFSNLKNYHFDIVHFQFGNSYPNSFVFKIYNALKHTDTKFVSTLHDISNMNLAKIIRIIGSSLRSIAYEFDKPSIQDILKRSSTVIVYSAFLKKKFVQKYGFEDKIKVVRHGGEPYSVSTKKDTRKDLGFDAREKIFCSFGYITPRKGYEAVIRSLYSLQDQLDFKYYIIGQFNFFHYKFFLIYLVRKLKLEKKVIFTGYLDYQTTNKYLRAADIIIQPRRYSTEGASGALVRALYSGSPIIATDIAGFSEYLINNRTGILVHHNEKEYADKVLEVCKKPELGSSLGKNALKWANNNLDWSVIAVNHFDIYKNIAKI